jgi:hypothetical protein
MNGDSGKDLIIETFYEMKNGKSFNPITINNFDMVEYVDYHNPVFSITCEMSKILAICSISIGYIYIPVIFEKAVQIENHLTEEVHPDGSVGITCRVYNPYKNVREEFDDSHNPSSKRKKSV